MIMFGEGAGDTASKSYTITAKYFDCMTQKQAYARVVH